MNTCKSSFIGGQATPMNRARIAAYSVLSVVCTQELSDPQRCSDIQQRQGAHEAWSVAADLGRIPRDRVPPPPTSSDIAWFNEHCWEGTGWALLIIFALLMVPVAWNWLRRRQPVDQ